MGRRVERSKSGAWDRWFLAREDLDNERRLGGPGKGARGMKVVRRTDTVVAMDKGKPRTAVRSVKISKKHDHVSSWWFK